MNGTLRQVLRQRRDEAARLAIRLEDERGKARYCIVCGCEEQNWTIDCERCTDRHRHWYYKRKHPNPTYYREQARKRETITGRRCRTV